MSHLLVLPVLLPLLAGTLQLFLVHRPSWTLRLVGLAACVALIGLAFSLTAAAAGGEITVYAIGGWPPPLGIVLVLDRLSAFMLLLTALLALPCLVAACGSWDRAGHNFHPLFMFQLAGINGAFLAGDLFNLYVFFEILLIASYCLMLHGGGEARLKAGIVYVVVNLIGSALLLIAVALLYGVTGSLNLADLGRSMPALDSDFAVLARVAAMLLFVVFGLKAAMLPLHFWLPAGYGAAAPPVAALFAIMTKVGAYAILRLSTVVFGAEAGDLAGILQPWLLLAALLTLWLGMIGALGSKGLAELAGFLLIASMGTLLTAFALDDADGLAAGLYYLAQSVPATAALFLLAGLIADRRGERGGDIAPGPALGQSGVLGFAFMLAALALVGLPPLGGFLGKMMLLQSVEGAATGWIFSSLLLTGLLGLIACSRAGVVLFWAEQSEAGEAPALPARHLLPVLVLLGGNIALTVGAGPLVVYGQAAAAQILDPARYHLAVLGEASGGER